MCVSPGHATAAPRLLVAKRDLKALRNVAAVFNRETGAIVGEIDDGAGDRSLSHQYPHILCDLRAPNGPTIAHTLPLTAPRGSIAVSAKAAAKKREAVGIGPLDATAPTLVN
jgi:hypothetical protein